MADTSSGAARLQKRLQNRKLKKHTFCRHCDISNILRDLSFGLNRPLKSVDDYFIRMLKIIRKTWEYIHIYINIYIFFSLGGFGGAEVACWPLIPKFAIPKFVGSNPAEAVGFLKGDKKSSARLPSEGK